MGRKPEDIIVMPEQLVQIFGDVVRLVRQTQIREEKIHLYGLTMPVGLATSDYGDVNKTLLVDEIPFETLEGMRDEIVTKLVEGYEVYIYTLNKVSWFDPASITPKVRYYMRYKCIHRSEWSEMITQTENNRRLADERGQWLGHWMEIGNETRGKIDETYTIQPNTDNLVSGKIKKFKF